MFAKEARRFDRMPLRIHEGGNAVTRFVVGPMMEWRRDDIIRSIAYAMPNRQEAERLWFHNITRGLFLSAEMHAIGKVLYPEAFVEGSDRPVLHDEAMEMFDHFRHVGCDLKSWMVSRYMICFGGAVAEARYLNRNTWDLIREQHDNGEDDFASLTRDLDLLKRRHPSKTMLRYSTNYLEWVFRQSDVWKATVAVAKMLRCGEVTPGSEIMSVIEENIKHIRLFDFNDLPPQARIRRDPTSNSVGTCLLQNLDDWKFSDISGGRQVRTERAFLYAKIWCSELIDGNVGHSCMHGDGPHQIWVCVLPKDNKENWDEITTEAAWGLHHAA